MNGEGTRATGRSPEKPGTGALPWLFFLLCLISTSASAATTPLDTAVEHYYAGYPGKAVGLLAPIAEAGDVDAQYLLGNMLYSLSKSNPGLELGDPIKWYRMAAAQDSADANYALGAIFNNRWLEYRSEADALLADSYYRRAQALGHGSAGAALNKLQQSRNTQSLTYSNESFNREGPASESVKKRSKAKASPQKLADAVTGFNQSGNPLDDARQLQQLLNEANSASGDTPDLSTLKDLLGNFESLGGLLSDLLQAYRYVDMASELPTEPGAN